LRQDDLLTGVDTTARLKSFVGLVIARLAYPRGMYRPYIFAGLGGHHSSQQLSGKPLAGLTWLGGGNESRMLVDARRTSAALGYGIGLDIFPTENIFFGAELRGVWLIGLDTDDTVALRAAGFTAHSQDDTPRATSFSGSGRNSNRDFPSPLAGEGGRRPDEGNYLNRWTPQPLRPLRKGRGNFKSAEAKHFY